MHAIRNAQDVCEKGGEVTIFLETMSANCRISISDTGYGMDSAFIRDRLFRPFDSTKGVEGMGIGAYQIRESVRSFGGEVDVDSQSGKGTALTMQIPLEN